MFMFQFLSNNFRNDLFCHLGTGSRCPLEEEMLNTENLNISPAFIDTLVMYSTDTTPCCHNLVVLITHHALYMTSPLFFETRI